MRKFDYTSSLFEAVDKIDLSEALDSAKMKVRDWYISEFPDDELGQDIPANLTFEMIYGNEAKIYDMLAPADDSIVRERVFEKTASLAGVSYDELYDRWLNEANECDLTEGYAEEITRVRNCCQVDDYYTKGNLMYFKVIDSDCEHYFDEFDIKQETIDGESYNVVDLSKINAKETETLAEESTEDMKTIAVRVQRVIDMVDKLPGTPADDNDNYSKKNMVKKELAEIVEDLETGVLYRPAKKESQELTEGTDGLESVRDNLRTILNTLNDEGSIDTDYCRDLIIECLDDLAVIGFEHLNYESEKLEEAVVPASQLDFKHTQLGQVQDMVRIIAELKAEVTSNVLYTDLMDGYDKLIKILTDAITEDPIGTVVGDGFETGLDIVSPEPVADEGPSIEINGEDMSPGAPEGDILPDEEDVL